MSCCYGLRENNGYLFYGPKEEIKTCDNTRYYNLNSGLCFNAKSFVFISYCAQNFDQNRQKTVEKFNSDQNGHCNIAYYFNYNL